MKQPLNEQDDLAQTALDSESSASRRRFTRNAVVGSAVLFSLGNRAAWGEATNTGVCLSAGVTSSLAAYEAGGVASLAAGSEAEIARYNERLRALPGNFENVEADGSTCVYEE